MSAAPTEVLPGFERSAPLVPAERLAELRAEFNASRRSRRDCLRDAALTLERIAAERAARG